MSTVNYTFTDSANKCCHKILVPYQAFVVGVFVVVVVIVVVVVVVFFF